MDGAEGAKTIVEPEEFLRSALEKIVFFECRVSQLESELAAARTTAERARGDAAQARRREVDLEQALAAERGQRGDAAARVDELEERVRLLQEERERLLGGLVERARLSGATGADGAPGPEEGGADLAGFIAELRAEIEVLRAWKAAAEAAGLGGPASVFGGPAHAAAHPERTAAQRHGHDGRPGPESVSMVADRFASDGRVGLTARDSDQMKALLGTRADRALYERSLDDLSASDAGRRLRAVRALEALGSKAAAPLLAAALGREPEAEVKAALLAALARFKEPFAADLAARALEDGRPAVRVAALEALAAVAADGAQERLSASLRDPSPIVRRRAALLLGFAPGAGAEEALATALADPDRGVARAAAAALSGRPTARAQGALARGLEHPDASVRRAAATALGRLAGEAVDADAPASARRATSRRIAEKLAAMGGEELRAAVLASLPATAPSVAARPPTATRTPTPTVPLVVRQAHHERPVMTTARPEAIGTSTARPAAVGTAVPAAVRTARPEPVEGRAGHASSPAPLLARVAVAVLEDGDAAPKPGDDLGPAIVSEVRAALRGCTAADLSRMLEAEPARIDAALAALAARGTLVQRGARWFMC
ncbi:HEAT repeat domain-containing protein [Anaeromyxobacter terrae]|uniref:HEAT repeat domain-containing protein n=1 Tax=Anaeromyxobacter terrae TaxID=2925406 RepID=UPI001F5ADE9B|nr:HEAT repeat domain-containing protein [Anaeromyxobacter sp. SG22]